MTVRPEQLVAPTGRRSSGLLLGLVFFVGLLIARAIVVSGLGDYLEERKPQLALSLGRDSPGVLGAAAAEALQVGRYGQAAKLSYAALDRSPLDVRALRVRGLALGAQGRVGEERALLNFAGERSWRDDETQAWLLMDNVRNRRLPEALIHADALARRREEMRPRLFQLFEIAAVAPDAAARLADQLAMQPNWRKPFLQALAASPQSDATVAHVFELISRSKAPLDADELGEYLARLAREGRYLDAYQALRSLGPPAWSGAVPFDGEFDNRKGVDPFDWQPVDRAGTDLDSLPSPGGGAGTALRVDYDGYSSTDLLHQAIALKPGAYRLTGQAFSETGDPTRLGWEVRCIADGSLLGRATVPDSAAKAWRPLAATFSVPPQGCDGLWLVLTGIPGERRTTIISWFDKISISPLS